MLTAFFLEAGFLGIMLFGWSRVHRSVHFVATCLVAGGSILSALWIVAANSWMQTPADFRLADGQLVAPDFGAVIFNPSTLIRFSHMVIAAFETSAFAVAGIGAFFLLKGRNVAFFRRSMAVALVSAALFAPLQVYLGDWKRQGGLSLSAGQACGHGRPLGDEYRIRRTFRACWPPRCGQGEKRVRDIHTVGFKPPRYPYAVGPGPRDSRHFPGRTGRTWRCCSPRSGLMVAIGFLFLFVMIWAAVLWKKEAPLQAEGLSLDPRGNPGPGWVAVEMGWITAEVGRQPWLVYGVMRTSEGLSPVRAGNVVWSLALFVVIFLTIGASYVYYVLKAFWRGPDMASPIPPVQRRAGLRIMEDSPSAPGDAKK